ncbi:MAG: SLC13 family permease [Candidatus Marinimicrobia bacterium]|jgi:di/tricarboxylate transporter|nr:SLC13 family permease [Candidatus Neomarinimicrobiota bacterium]MBT4270078.1 SLC13 family permease [Candidatus Neomarinimicrobiota bacterium]MBT4372932.1 SLC13 family permease [Candidatus Neomarinimicrobiota bacterium]MBT6130034.1 SLC13 family permease [Candidatus Neomarinimicrobiota bacterium]MBT7496374.1 SLC13 family permease [Candidatus Neomarinimicrobiota bacterium]
MTFEIAFVLFIIVLAFILFVSETFTLDVSALVILSILFLGGFLTPEEAISGLANPAVITIALLFTLSHALQKTRILEYLIVRINQLVSKSRTLGLGVYLLTIGFASALVNNTAIVAIFMPVTIRLAHQYRMSPSKLLIPLSYAAILGGTLTLVGTSTNLLVNSIYMANSGGESLGMFEFAKYGLIIMAVGLVYIIWIAPKLLPSRTVTSSLTQSYHLAGYLTEMKIVADSPLVGSSCKDRQVNQNYDVMVLDIQRDGYLLSQNVGARILKEGDVLFVKGTVDSFLRMKEVEKVTLLTDEKLTQKELEQKDNILMECMITDKSDLIGQSLMTSNFRQRFGAFILAIRREGAIIRKKIAHVILNNYDTLLIYGTRKNLDELAEKGEFILLGEVHENLRKVRFWWMSILALGMAVLLATLGIMPILKGALIGTVVLLVFRVLKPHEVYQSINMQVIILIAALIPLGIVIQSTGTAEWIGSSISKIVLSSAIEWQPYVLLAVVYFITMVLTELSSNAATAIIMTPVVLAVTSQLGVDSRPFIFAVCFAASASFVTPVGYQTNLMVYGPGGYKFSDYIKVGLPLAVIMFVLAIVFIPILWPF